MKPLLTLLAIATAACGQNERGFERTLTVNGPAHLDLSTDAGGIVVLRGPAGSVRVRAILKPQTGSFFAGNVEDKIRRLVANPPVQQTGNTIRAGYVSDKSLLKGVSMRLEVTAPPDSEVRARADSGGIRVEGVNGPVDAKTDSGGIRAADIGGEVRAEADSGGIHMRNVRGRVYARTDSGGIEAEEAGGEVDAQADSGGIRVSQRTAAAIRARADSGGVQVRLAPSGGYDIKASSESGGLSVPEMTARGEISRHRAEGKVRGGGPLVDVKASSGRVVIE